MSNYNHHEILPYSFPPWEDGIILVAIGWLPLRPTKRNKNFKLDTFDTYTYEQVDLAKSYV